MSLPDLVSGGAGCGPVNPLQQLGKRFGQDRGAQFDSFGKGVPGRPPAFRTQASGASTSAGDPAFFAPEPAAPFQVDELRASLPHVGPPWPSAMEASFYRHQVPRASTASSSSSATPAWAQDFLRASSSAQGVSAPASHGAMPRSTPLSAVPLHHRPFPAMLRMSAAPPPQAVPRAPDALESVSASSWESAFTAADAQQGGATESRLDAMNDDELAQAAEHLLHAVQHDTSDKFQQSEFLQLMRKLRDRHAVVRGDSIVDQDAKGKSKAPPTQADLDAMLQHAASQAARPTQRGEHVQTADALADLEAFWREEDQAKEKPAPPAASFVGDSGDVAARMREDDDLFAREYHKWTSLGTQVPGATAQWEEDWHGFAGDEDFVGRAWQGPAGHGVRGAQNAEWAKFQREWDAFDAEADGVRPVMQSRAHEPFPFEAPRYRFHDANPWAAHPAHHATPTMLDTVLEHEAAVQAHPTDASKWYHLGLRQQENERETQAIAALHEALQLDPTMKDAWLALAVSYTNENEREEALEALDRWIHVHTKYHSAVQSFLSQRRHLPEMSTHKRLANVLMAMARASAQDPQQPIDGDVQVALGVLFNSSGEYDKAVDCFTTALQVSPDDWILYNRIGATLSNSGRSEESLQYYQEALRLRPDFARCHFNLSISCLNLKMYTEAAEHAYTALTLQQASGDDVPGPPNHSLWEILRVSLELMRRPDLATLCLARDLNQIHLDQIVGTI